MLKNSPCDIGKEKKTRSPVSCLYDSILLLCSFWVLLRCWLVNEATPIKYWGFFFTFFRKLISFDPPQHAHPYISPAATHREMSKPQVTITLGRSGQVKLSFLLSPISISFYSKHVHKLGLGFFYAIWALTCCLICSSILWFRFKCSFSSFCSFLRSKIEFHKESLNFNYSNLGHQERTKARTKRALNAVFLTVTRWFLTRGVISFCALSVWIY